MTQDTYKLAGEVELDVWMPRELGVAARQNRARGVEAEMTIEPEVATCTDRPEIELRRVCHRPACHRVALRDALNGPWSRARARARRRA